MPQAVAAWADNYPITAKSLNTAAYTIDGTPGRPNGILFQVLGKLWLEQGPSLGTTVLTSAPGPAGTHHPLSSSGSVYNGTPMLDGAGYFGATSDGTPFSGSYYQYVASVPGSSGDGTTTGGWHILSHVVPIFTTSSQQVIGAEFIQGTSTICGTRQRSANLGAGNTFSPWVLDLMSTAAGTVQPGLFLADSSSAATGVYRTLQFDLSNAAPRMTAIWAAAETASAAAYGTQPLPAPASAWSVTSTVSAAWANGSQGFGAVLNFLNNAPAVRSYQLTNQSIANTTATPVTLGTVSVDNFGGWASGTYTVQRPGIYLAHALLPWAANTTGERMTGLAVNGTIFWGPGSERTPSGICASAKTQILSLNANDTVVPYCWQNSGGALALDSTNQSRMFLAWLGKQGVPATLWSPPDTTFRWTAGTPGYQLPGVFTQHHSNDLGFLVQKPYLLAYQGTAQTGLANNAAPVVTMDTIAGIVHADTGDSYSGWSAANHWYVAPRNGWYLVTGELFGNVPTTTTLCLLTAATVVNTSGGHVPNVTTGDWSQAQFASLSAAAPAGSAIFGLVYLLAGEHIAPVLYAANYTSTTWNTIANSTVSGGQVGCHMEIVWVGELSPAPPAGLALSFALSVTGRGKPMDPTVTIALVTAAAAVGSAGAVLWRGGRRDGKLDAVLEQLTEITKDHEARLRAGKL